MKHKDYLLSRRQFVYQTVLGMGSVLTLSTAGYPLHSQKGNYVIAKTENGKIRGLRDNGVNIFKGIPYAGKVSGDRRFARPATAERWKGIRDALQLGNPAMQGSNSTYGINELKPAEDCLFLNVWTPANDIGKRPVMFYNHGGGFATGSGGSTAQDGANLARYFDVVVVQTNHRLNIFGFLYLGEVAGKDYATSGNNGMLDITDGLKWVNRNIAEFGGDPDNVMIFGESGGGAKTSCLYAMPDAAGYFNKASIESGPGIRMTPLESAVETTNLLLKELDINPKEWRKLLDIPADKLYAAQQALQKAAAAALAARSSQEKPSRGIGSSRLGGFSPVVDGIALKINPFDPSAPEISRNKPLIVGWNEDEYTFFGMSSGDLSGFQLESFEALHKKLEPRFAGNTARIIETYRKSRPDASPSNIFVEISSVTMMGLGSIEIAEKKSIQGGAPVYLYNFGFKSDQKVRNTDYPLGTPHAMDIAFKFNNIRAGGLKNAVGMAGERPDSYKASLNFAELWTTFARRGKPGAKDQPEWPQYDLIKQPTYRIDTSCEVIYNRNWEERELWKSLGLIGG